MRLPCSSWGSDILFTFDAGDTPCPKTKFGNISERVSKERLGKRISVALARRDRNASMLNCKKLKLSLLPSVPGEFDVLRVRFGPCFRLLTENGIGSPYMCGPDANICGRYKDTYYMPFLFVCSLCI